MIRTLLLSSAAFGLAMTATSQEVAIVNAKIWTGTAAVTITVLR